MVPVGEASVVAEIGHEGHGSPPKQPLDIQGREAHGMQRNASPNSQGVGTPFLEFLLVLDGVEVVDRHSQGTHEILDVCGCHEVDGRRGPIPVAGQRMFFSERWVKVHEGLESLKCSVAGSYKADTIRIRIASEEPLFAIVTVLLCSEFDPELVDLFQGN